MRKKKIFILVANEPYGNTDWVYLTNEAKLKGFQTEFIGRGVKDGKIYYPEHIELAKSRFDLLKKSLLRIREHAKKDTKFILIVRFFHLALVLKILSIFVSGIRRQSICLDVRTSSVQPSRIKRSVSNQILKFTAQFFDDVLVISHSVAKRLGVKKYKKLPFGFRGVSQKRKKLDLTDGASILKCVYVGTVNRPGLVEFFDSLTRTCFANSVNLLIDVYTENTEANLLKRIEEISSTRICGKLKRDDFQHILSNYHIGLSPLPDSDLYDYQPHTKIFEYLECGLPYVTKRTPGVEEQLGSSKYGWHYDNLGESLDIIVKDIKFSYKSRHDAIPSFKAPSWDQIFLVIERIYENNNRIR